MLCHGVLLCVALHYGTLWLDALCYAVWRDTICYGMVCCGILSNVVVRYVMA